MGDMNRSAATPASATNPYAPPTADLIPGDETGTKTLAHPGRRLVASIIDGLILTAVFMPPLVLYFGGFSAYSTAVTASFLSQLAVLTISTVIYLLINGYFLARDAQSIGKKIMRIKIMRTNGEKADFMRIVVRRFLPVQLSSLVPVVGPFLGLIEVLFIFRASRKCLHDDIADTIVVML